MHCVKIVKMFFIDTEHGALQALKSEEYLMKSEGLE